MSSNRASLGQGLALLCAFVLVSVVVGYLSYIAGSVERETAYLTTVDANEDREAAIAACDQLAPAELAPCLYDRLGSQRNQIRDDQDLRAQNSMAFWAAMMAILSVAQAGFAGWALWFLRADLTQNRKSSESQQRAYVSTSAWG